MIFYILEIGKFIFIIINALIEALNNGKKCLIILDSIGSYKFYKSPYLKLMRSAGFKIIEILYINYIIILLRRIDLRQHRKIILIDQYISYIGSINIINPISFKKNIYINPWIDIITRISGILSISFNFIIFNEWILYNTQKNIKFINFFIIPSGPGYKKKIIKNIIIFSIFYIKKKIFFISPYVIFYKKILFYIYKKIYKKKYLIFLIIPKYNDSFLVTWASRLFYNNLLKLGINLYEFKGGFLHTKNILIDNYISIIGTINLDIRSIILNYEIILFIKNYKIYKELKLIVYHYIRKSNIITVNNWYKRPLLQNIIEVNFSLFKNLL